MQIGISSSCARFCFDLDLRSSSIDRFPHDREPRRDSTNALSSSRQFIINLRPYVIPKSLISSIATHLHFHIFKNIDKKSRQKLLSPFISSLRQYLSIFPRYSGILATKYNELLLSRCCYGSRWWESEHRVSLISC